MQTPALNAPNMSVQATCPSCPSCLFFASMLFYIKSRTMFHAAREGERGGVGGCLQLAQPQGQTARDSSSPQSSGPSSGPVLTQALSCSRTPAGAQLMRASCWAVPVPVAGTTAPRIPSPGATNRQPGIRGPGCWLKFLIGQKERLAGTLAAWERHSDVH